MSHRSPQHSQTAPPTSLTGALLSIFSWMPIRLRWCGSAPPPTLARSHLPTEAFASAPFTSNQWPSFMTLKWWSTLSCRCAFTCHEQRRHASIICVACGPSVGSLVATSRHGLCQPSSCRYWITAMPSLQAFRLRCWCRSREYCMPQLVWCWIPGSPATWPRVCGFEGAALAPSHATNWLQALLVSPQVIAWSSAGVHHQHVEGSCGRPSLSTLRMAASGNYT